MRPRQGLRRLEKHWKIKVCLEKSLKIKSPFLPINSVNGRIIILMIGVNELLTDSQVN